MYLAQWRHSQKPLWSRLKMGRCLKFHGSQKEVIDRVKCIEHGSCEIIWIDVRRIEELTDYQVTGDELISNRNLFLGNL